MASTVTFIFVPMDWSTSCNSKADRLTFILTGDSRGEQLDKKVSSRAALLSALSRYSSTLCHVSSAQEATCNPGLEFASKT